MVVCAIVCLAVTSPIPGCSCDGDQGLSDGGGSGRWVCKADSECGGRWICHLPTGECLDPSKGCTKPSECTDPDRTCDPASGRCVKRCTEHHHCTDGMVCNKDEGRCEKACEKDGDCPSGKTCDPGTGLCVHPPFRCTKDEDCKDRPEGHLCHKESGRCYAPGTLP